MNAADFRALMERWAVVMADHRDWLIQLDSVVGDSDLGLTMSDGFRAAADAVNGAPAADVGKTAYIQTFDKTGYLNSKNSNKINRCQL